MKEKLIFLVCVVLITVVLFVRFFKPANTIDQSQNNKLQVSTSFYPLYFFASEIGGQKASVANITPAGSEPHDYEPTTQDIARIEDGNMLVLNGGVEGWGEKIKENLKATHVEIVTAAEDILTKQLTENGKTLSDPHVWLDPVLAKQEVQKITNGYIAIDSNNTSYYLNNQKKLDNKLDALDLQYKQGLQSCKLHTIVTSHAAFAYLAQRYGLTQLAITGLSPDEEPSAKQLSTIADFAKKNNIRYIFFERLINPRISETIAHEVGAQTLVLDPIEGLSDDDMRAGKTYFTIMKNNLKNLQLALQCSK